MATPHQTQQWLVVGRPYCCIIWTINTPFMSSSNWSFLYILRNEISNSRTYFQVVSHEVYQKYLQRSLVTAESTMDNSYHCKTPDCLSFCVYEDDVNFFLCPVCDKNNCLTCKAIHDNMNCQEYQEDLILRSAADSEARNTQHTLQVCYRYNMKQGGYTNRSCCLWFLCHAKRDCWLLYEKGLVCHTKRDLSAMLKGNCLPC